jgi:hypothetical protein
LTFIGLAGLSGLGICAYYIGEQIKPGAGPAFAATSPALLFFVFSVWSGEFFHAMPRPIRIAAALVTLTMLGACLFTVFR